MPLPTGPQVDAAMRHVYTSAGTVMALAAAVAVIPQESVQPAMDALRQIGDGLHQIFGGASKLIVIVGPIIGIWMGKIAAGSASFKSQFSSVFKTASEPQNVEQKNEVVAATAALPEVEKIVAPAIAADVPSAKVVAQ